MNRFVHDIESERSKKKEVIIYLLLLIQAFSSIIGNDGIAFMFTPIELSMFLNTFDDQADSTVHISLLSPQVEQ